MHVFTRETLFFSPQSIQNLLELATHLALTHQVRRDYWKELAGVPVNNNQTRGWQKDRSWLPELHLLRCNHSSSGWTWAAATAAVRACPASGGWREQQLAGLGGAWTAAASGFWVTALHWDPQGAPSTRGKLGRLGAKSLGQLAYYRQVIGKGKFVWWKGLRTRSVK